jgi:hypothetical protein
MNLEGDLTWYLRVLYNRCPTTGTVTGSQECYIDKLLQQHEMQNCNPVAVPFLAKCDDILIQLAVPSAPQCIRQPRPRVYLKEGTYHTRLFRGPSTNGMKK